MRVNINIPVCVSCHTILGNKYPIFDDIRTNRIKDITEKNGYTPNNVEEIGMGDVLDNLDVKNICCRKSMLCFVRQIPTN